VPRSCIGSAGVGDAVRGPCSGERLHRDGRRGQCEWQPAGLRIPRRLHISATPGTRTEKIETSHEDAPGRAAGKEENPPPARGKYSSYPYGEDRNPRSTGICPDPSSEPSDQSELVESLQDQISYLRDQLEAEREAGRRKDHLLAAALERIPAIEPPPEPREAPETVTGEPTKGAPKEQPYTQEEEGEGGERSWWRRFFGIE
jgi:hypothetical protein